MSNSQKWKQQDKEYHEDDAVVDSYDRRITRKFFIEHKYFSLQPWVAELKRNGAKLVLDFGCGTGTASLELMRQGLKAISVDASVVMLQKLFEKSKTALLKPCGIVSDVETLALKDNVFDGILCFGVLHHLPSVTGGLQEQLRVLKKGGQLYIAEPFRHKPWVSYPYYVLLSMARCVCWFFKKSSLSTQERTLTHAHLKEIRELLNKDSFVVDISYFVYWPNVFGYLPESLALAAVKLLNKINGLAKRGDIIFIKIKKISD